MKKTAYTIICSFLAVIVLTLSFSNPVYAKGLIYTFNDISYTQSRTFSLKSTNGTLTTLYDGTQFGSIVASGQSGEFYVDIPLRLWQWNNSSSVYLDASGLILNFVGFVPLVTVRSSFGPDLECYITSVDLISNTGASSPIHLPSYESASSCIFDMSQVVAGSSSIFSDAFVVRMLVHYYCGIKSVSVGSSQYVVSGSYSVSFGYQFSSLKIYSFDLQSDIRLNNMTNNINNKIQEETRNQTNSLQNGYDNSSMTSDNTRLNDQIAKYDAAQQSATNTSVNNIDAADFVNPSSNASIFAAMTFSASFLQSLYNNIGDFGTVVMVSLSLCLGLMLVGWFKFRKGG